MNEPFDLEKFKSVGFVGVKLRGDRTTFQRDFDKKNNAELSDYKALRDEGSQPDGTYRQHIEKAKRISDKLGTAYRGDDRTGMMQKAGLAGDVTPIRGLHDNPS